MNDSPVELLVLARLLVAGEKGETLKKLATDLNNVVSEGLETTLEKLEDARAIERIKDKKGKLTAKWVLTDLSQSQILERLGLSELPPKTTWGKLKSAHLVALALGKPGQPVGSLKVEILRAHHGLDLADKATAAQVGNAMTAKLFGLEPGQTFNVDTILRKLLRDVGIDHPSGIKPTPATISKALFERELGPHSSKTPVDLIVSRSVEARNQTPGELGDAVLRTWIKRLEPPRTEPHSAPIPVSLDDFLTHLAQAARSSPTGWFGDAKVFISHVWNTLRRDRDFHGLSLEDFKKRLLEAHQAKRIELSRADLIDAMDPTDVRESATPDENAVYHFVRIEEPAR